MPAMSLDGVEYADKRKRKRLNKRSIRLPGGQVLNSSMTADEIVDILKEARSSDTRDADLEAKLGR